MSMATEGVERFEPEAMQYKAKQTHYAIQSKAKTKTIFPENGSTFSPTGTSTIRFNMTGDLIDFSESYISFTLNISTQAGSPDYSSTAFINRWIVRGAGGTIVDDFPALNVYATAMFQARSSTEFLKSTGSFWGCPKIPYKGTQKGLVASGASRDMALPLSWGILGASAPIPMFLLPTGLQLEIQLEHHTTALVHSTEGATYTLTNVEMHLHDIKVESDTKSELMAKVASEGQFEIPYEGVEIIPDSYSATAGGTKICRLPSSATSIRAIYGLIRDESYISTGTAASLSCRTGEGFSSCYLTNGADTYPEGRITNKVKAYHELKKALGHSLPDVSGIGQITYDSYTDVATKDFTTTVSSYDDAVTHTFAITSITANANWSTIADTAATCTASTATVTTTASSTHSPLTLFAVGVDTESFEKDDERLLSGIPYDNMSMTYVFSGPLLFDATPTYHARRFDHVLIVDKSMLIMPNGMVATKV